MLAVCTLPKEPSFRKRRARVRFLTCLWMYMWVGVTSGGLSHSKPLGEGRA